MVARVALLLQPLLPHQLPLQLGPLPTIAVSAGFTLALREMRGRPDLPGNRIGAAADMSPQKMKAAQDPELLQTEERRT